MFSFFIILVFGLYIVSIKMYRKTTDGTGQKSNLLYFVEFSDLRKES